MKPHDGNQMPCDPDCRVVIQQRDGFIDRSLAKHFGWTHRLGHDGLPWHADIVAWKFDDEACA